MWKRERKGYTVLCWREPGSRRIYTKPEHVYIWEQANGPIPDGHIVHHANGERKDNRLENLVLVSRADHPRYHTSNVRQTEQGWKRHCPVCDLWKPVDDFYRRGPTGRQRYCKNCQRRNRRQWAQENREHFNAYMREYRKRGND